MNLFKKCILVFPFFLLAVATMPKLEAREHHQSHKNYYKEKNSSFSFNLNLGAVLGYLIQQPQPVPVYYEPCYETRVIYPEPVYRERVIIHTPVVERHYQERVYYHSRPQYRYR